MSEPQRTKKIKQIKTCSNEIIKKIAQLSTAFNMKTEINNKSDNLYVLCAPINILEKAAIQREHNQIVF